MYTYIIVKQITHQTEETDMIKSEIKVYSEKVEKEIIAKLARTGYAKTADCMWAKIYRKGNLEVIVSREY